MAAQRRGPKLIYVEWWDSAGPSDSVWHLVEDLGHGLSLARSVGWLLKETRDLITLAAHLVDEDETGANACQASGVMTIPRAAIRRRVTMRPPAGSTPRLPKGVL